jgi:hypothetical protein
VRFSFTRLDTYRRCPYQYRLRYQLRLPGQPRPGTRLALALHAALASFYRELPTQPRLSKCWEVRALALMEATRAGDWLGGCACTNLPAST